MKCEKCGKEINENEEKIYNGLCEHCYNKWINKKEHKNVSKEVKEESKKEIISIVAFVLGCVSIIIAICFLATLPLLPILALASAYSSKSNAFDLIMYSVLLFPFLSLFISSFAICKDNNIYNKIGLAFSIISTIITGCCFFTFG